ncbi:hypothetical protein BD309DRAFT_873873 [Dichomitus squalens]|uniref:Uncharacterized protein n=1 Tax=Dichomitus squalens TaxID=114155 RepID=A0A4Q9Q095_9APHY|nr:hypothetical protein BD309DRAFT_873873 [Dichomitus squalens]TBU60415.1 hypothetical protein BD310DRAFT_975922 [Dichomitus squalens]
MTPSIWINFGTETSSSSYADWVGVPGSPGSSNQALMSLDDVPDFDKDVDDALNFNFDDPINPCRLGAQSDWAIDWQDIIINSALPFPLALTDDASSITDTVHQPLSPVSDGTLIDSPCSSLIPDCKLPPQGDQHVDHVLPSSSESSSFDGFEFDFTFDHGQVTVMPLPASSYGLSAGYGAPVYDYDGFWPGYPLVQHTVGAAGAGAPGPATGMDMNVGDSAFSFMALPFSPPASSPVDEKDDMIVVDEKAAEVVKEKDAPVVKKKPARATRMKRRTDSDDGYSSGDSNTSDAPSQQRKRRKQDTTKRYICSFEGCEEAFARTHNLKQHFDSRHLGKRPYGCRELGCEWSFSKKHDLTRHHQSKHTDLGSPRNAGNAKKGNAKKQGKTIVKKDEHDQ